MSKLSYRKNVAMIILSGEGKILICERSDVADAWQLPQGGIEHGETAEQAMWRELREEVGNIEVEIISKLEQSICYDWPPSLYRDGYCGQEQYYFLLRKTGEREVDLQTASANEFVSFRWTGLADFFSSVVGFKTDSYRKALDLFISQHPDLISS